MPTYPSSSRLLVDAEAMARALLAHDSDRLAHCHYAASIAELAADALGLQDPDALIAAAWLHDIGYSPAIARTGFHPLDGALHLAAQGWPDTTVLLVAHHSHAAVVASYYGVEHQLSVLDHASADAEDILTYADLRSGPTGMGAVPAERINGKRARHRGDSRVPVDVREARYRLLLQAADRITEALDARPHQWSARRPPQVVGLSGSRLGK